MEEKDHDLSGQCGRVAYCAGAAFAAADPSPEQVKPTARQTTEVSQTSPKTGDLAMTQVGVAAITLLGAGTVALGLRQRKVR